MYDALSLVHDPVVDYHPSPCQRRRKRPRSDPQASKWPLTVHLRYSHGTYRKSPGNATSALILLALIFHSQLYNDWIYLWWTAYVNRPFNHGHVYIVLKESIMYIPIVGLGLRLAGFVFMSRNMKTDTPRLTRRLGQLTRRSKGGEGGLSPMWLMMFPEGTNLSRNGRAKSVKWAERQGEKDLKYTLIPRSTGTYFCLKALNGTVEWVYDCTLAYDGVP